MKSISNLLLCISMAVCAVCTGNLSAMAAIDFTAPYMPTNGDNAVYTGAFVSGTQFTVYDADGTAHSYDFNYTIKDGAVSNPRATYGGSVKTSGGYFNLSYPTSNGGAISLSSNGIISDMLVDFINNTGDYGGAIYGNNPSHITINSITGDFINNTGEFGGALHIRTTATIGAITGNFIGNTSDGSGGAIVTNGGDIGPINANFINNSGQSSNSDGGAIMNYRSIAGINGSFIANHAGRNGGAINTQGDLGDITGYFNGNYVNSNIDTAGGAIYYQTSAVSNISADFVHNYAESSDASASGGAIDNNAGTIGDITGDFSNNYVQSDSMDTASAAYGGAIYNGTNSVLGNISADFTKNSSIATNSAGVGGGAIYNGGTLGNVNGDFIENFATSNTDGYGGAITNYNGQIPDIIGDFIGNYITALSNVGGGAIYNQAGTIDNITGNFSDNYVHSETSQATGGAISNYAATITGAIKGSFTNNYAIADANMAVGGAIATNGSINEIIADFDKNYANGGASGGAGGAIYNEGSGNTINSIKDSTFTNNYATSTGNKAIGGAIANNGATINNIAADFSNNYVYGDNIQTLGGAIWNTGTIGDITGNFTGNYAESNSGAVAGGAIDNSGTIGDITGDFIGNYAKSDNGDAAGGAIYNTGKIGNISGDFINNSVIADTGVAMGGAIYSLTDLTFIANGTDYLISGNTTNDQTNGLQHNAITTLGLNMTAAQLIPGLYMTNIGVNLSNSGTYTIDDTINSTSMGLAALLPMPLQYTYNLNITGDGSDGNAFIVNNTLYDVANVNITDSTLRFGTGPYGQGEFLISDTGMADMNAMPPTMTLNNGTFDLHNGYNETVDLAALTTNGDSFINIDASPADLTADTINVSGDITGTARVVVYADNTTNPHALGDLWFANSATGGGTADSFQVYRVFGNAYMQDVDFVQNDDGSQSWGWAYDESLDKPLTPEVTAYTGLHAAAVMQSANIIQNVRDKLQMDQNSGRGDLHTHETMFQVWAAPVYQHPSVSDPVKISSDVWGAEVGADVRFAQTHTIGIFGSYRDGDHHLDADKMSPIESQIDLRTYSGGVYYRYDDDKFWAFLSGFAGTADADVDTADGVSASTRGAQYGAGAELGYVFNLTKYWTLSPSVSGEYININFDNASDDFGKIVSYDDLGYGEAEAGLRLEHMWDNHDGIAKLYLKPGIVRTFSDGANATITGLGNVDTLNDATLGRIELGGRYTFSQVVDLSAFVNYSAGTDYSAFGAGLQLNLKF